MKKFKKMTKKEYLQIRGLYKMGMTVKQAMIETGRSWPTCYYIKKAGNYKKYKNLMLQGYKPKTINKAFKTNLNTEILKELQEINLNIKLLVYRVDKIANKPALNKKGWF